ncbi:Helicase SKI2W [Branchiostoma belcheri]|nr:Helicase SKI2W [Branchiostoma belcheri]
MALSKPTSTEPVYTPGTARGAKLAALLVDEGTALVRKILEEEVLKMNPPSLREQLKKHKRYLCGLRHLNPGQRKKLYPPGGNVPYTAQGFDISLLELLLKDLVRKELGRDAPCTVERDRLRRFRNDNYGHISSTDLSEADFDKLWDELTDILVALGGDRDKISERLNSSIDSEQEKKHFDLLEKFYKEDMEVKDLLLAQGEILKKGQEEVLDQGKSLLKGQETLLNQGERQKKVQEEIVKGQEALLAQGESQRKEILDQGQSMKKELKEIKSLLEEDRDAQSPGTSSEQREDSSSRTGFSDVTDDVITCLKDLYRTEYAHVRPLPWCEDLNLHLGEVFTNLQLQYRDDRGRFQYTGTIVSLADIYEGEGIQGNVRSAVKKVRIEGDPGIGKSCSCQKLAYDWSCGKLDRFKVVFFLEMRHLAGKVKDEIFEQLLPKDTNTTLDQLWSYIQQNQNDVLFILDGLDELSQAARQVTDVVDLIQSKILRNCHVLVTSRPYHCVEDLAKCHQFYRIVGYSRKNSKEFIGKYFYESPESASKLVERLQLDQLTFLRDSYLSQIVVNPLNNLLICVVWEDNNDQLPSSKAELYEMIVLSVAKRFCTKKALPTEGDKLPPDIEAALRGLGKLSWEGLEQEQLQFNIAQIRETYDKNADNVLNMGLLTRDYSFSRIKRTCFCAFLHKTFQEYMAARYICGLITDGSSREEGMECLRILFGLRNTTGVDRELMLASRRKYEAIQDWLLLILGKNADPLFDMFAEELNKVQTDEDRDALSFVCITWLGRTCAGVKMAEIVVPCLPQHATNNLGGLIDFSEYDRLLAQMIVKQNRLRSLKLKIGELVWFCDGIGSLTATLQSISQHTTLAVADFELPGKGPINLGEIETGQICNVDPMVHQLTECIKKNKVLKTLKLRWRLIDELPILRKKSFHGVCSSQSLSSLCSAIQRNRTLETLEIDGMFCNGEFCINPMSCPDLLLFELGGLQEIIDELMRNKPSNYKELKITMGRHGTCHQLGKVRGQTNMAAAELESLEAQKTAPPSAELLDCPFSLLEVGCAGKVHVCPGGDTAKHPLPLLTTLPHGLPPVLQDLQAQLRGYLQHPEDLPIHDFQKAQKFWPRERDPESLYSAELCPVQTTLQVDRNPTTGELLGYKEVYLQDTGISAKNSLSLRRPPGPPTEATRGSSTNYPFWPGGMDEPDLGTVLGTEGGGDIDFENDLLSCPPGFENGVDFKKLKKKEEQLAKMAAPSQHAPNEEKEVEEQPTLQRADSLENMLPQDPQTAESPIPPPPGQPPQGEEQIPRLVRCPSPHPRGSLPRDPQAGEAPRPPPLGKVPQGEEQWAVKVDISTPVADFHRRIPNPAYQKQAILHLENHDSVFVAAHTSAGKTVVAEYAIALSQKHVTRTVYTSPIKALSNQKFRDFKQTFEDVGLLTGDVQLRPEAACLIMTTEILRSMLYNGSDVIRDLEWVIFDEVHYINDAERGVVWEEVLIMLPEHVNIILLSATVPNTMEFADWIGRTKKKKIYVISTLKRPVPLEHFLYTGNSKQTSKERFLIVDSARNFLTKGYYAAIDAKKARASKSSSGYGAKGTRGGDPRQEKNVWLSIIQAIQRDDKLPVVAFTFSKRRCDDNAAMLTSIDLTTAAEKSEIHLFIQKSLHRLKGPDRDLPQVKHLQELLKRGLAVHHSGILCLTCISPVKHLQELLKRGLAVHHSGILPILKEVVEMLFSRGLVKFLFATETFAMGVNMPARTVLFDSIRKHDGTQMRDLLPGEYIQMAGRAGRRGLDTTGTVIILCKGDVPEMADLHKMMLGKPTQLESRFRLTYTMILNLLRVEELRVEDMMKRSFSEFHTRKDTQVHQREVKDVQEKLKTVKEPDCLMCGVDLENYYMTCKELWELRRQLQKQILTSPHGLKALSAGRVVTVSNHKHNNALGVVLQVTSGSGNEKLFTTLIICDPSVSESPTSDPRPDHKVTPVLPNSALFLPDGPCGHVIELLRPEDITMATTSTLKVNADRIVDDVRKRQQPRFRNDPPGQSVTVATQELLRLTETHPGGLTPLDPVKDLGVRDVDSVEQLRRRQFLLESLHKFSCIHCTKFREHFAELRENIELKDRLNHLCYLLSDNSLALLPEYEQRVQVLKRLRYLDAAGTVQLKGRVACEISNHELLITELVFENVLTDLQPQEIAALLSCIVFQERRCVEPTLTETLQKGKDAIIAMATRLAELQRECGVNVQVEDCVEELKFGLTEAVYQWAQGMPFSKITELTDVQEGVIVRCIQRLDEACRDVRSAARIIGDPNLYAKMELASEKIKRDIVFAASLYTQ